MRNLGNVRNFDDLGLFFYSPARISVWGSGGVHFWIVGLSPFTLCVGVAAGAAAARLFQARHGLDWIDGGLGTGQLADLFIGTYFFTFLFYSFYIQHGIFICL